MESKEENKASEAPLLTTVARWFKDQAFMCSKDEGLEVVFGAADPENCAASTSWPLLRRLEVPCLAERSLSCRRDMSS